MLLLLFLIIIIIIIIINIIIIIIILLLSLLFLLETYVSVQLYAVDRQLGHISIQWDLDKMTQVLYTELWNYFHKRKLLHSLS